MERFYRGSLVLLLATTLSACSIFSSDEEEVRTPKPLQTFDEKIELRQIWSASIGSGVGDRFETLRPAVSGDKLFVAGANGNVKALNRDSGKQLWQIQLDNTRVGAGVSVGDGLVLLGTLDGEVVALSQDDGEVLWKARVSSEVLSTPVTDGQYVAVQSIDDSLTVLNAVTGKLLWSQESLQPALTLRGSAQPVLLKDVVITGFASGEAKAFRLENGAQVWGSRIAAPEGSTELERMVDINGAPLIVGDALYLASFQGNVAALDLYSGRIRWSKEISSYKSMTEGFGSLYLTDENSYISAVDQKSGASSWRQDKLEYRWVTAPAAFSSYVAVGDMDGYIHLLSQVDGSVAGRIKADSSAIKVQPVVDGDLMFVLSSGGKLVALRQK